MSHTRRMASWLLVSLLIAAAPGFAAGTRQGHASKSGVQASTALTAHGRLDCPAGAAGIARQAASPAPRPAPAGVKAPGKGQPAAAGADPTEAGTLRNVW